jgi:hypothetical protein
VLDPDAALRDFIERGQVAQDAVDRALKDYGASLPNPERSSGAEG